MSDPSFCWLCSKALSVIEGKTIYAVIRFGPEAHRVHKACAENHNDQHTDDYHTKRTGRDMVNRALRQGPDVEGDVMPEDDDD